MTPVWQEIYVITQRLLKPAQKYDLLTFFFPVKRYIFIGWTLISSCKNMIYSHFFSQWKDIYSLDEHYLIIRSNKNAIIKVNKKFHFQWQIMAYTYVPLYYIYLCNYVLLCLMGGKWCGADQLCKYHWRVMIFKSHWAVLNKILTRNLSCQPFMCFILLADMLSYKCSASI